MSWHIVLYERAVRNRILIYLEYNERRSKLIKRKKNQRSVFFLPLRKPYNGYFNSSHDLIKHENI